MDLNWQQQDSINPFLTTSPLRSGSNENLQDYSIPNNNFNVQNPNSNHISNGINQYHNHHHNCNHLGKHSRIMENPLKINSDLAIKNFDSLESKSNVKMNLNLNTSSNFKPIPLPDDILGFNNLPTPGNPLLPSSVPLLSQMSNSSFNIENYLKSDDNDIDNIDNDFLDANLNMNSNVKDELEKVLLDLGISEIPLQEQKSSQKPTHKRQLSGSRIFGFIGEGDNTQLSIPGIEPVRIINKKPLYKDITNFDNLDFLTNRLPAEDYNEPNFNINPNLSLHIDNNVAQNITLGNTEHNNIQIPPSTPYHYQEKNVNSTANENDYYLPTGNQGSYKFPPSPPKGSFKPTYNRSQQKSSDKYTGHEYQPLNNYSATKPLQNTNEAINMNTFSQIPTETTSATTETEQTAVKTTNYSNVDVNKMNGNPQLFNTPIAKSDIPTPLPTSPLNSVAMSSPIKFQTPRHSPRKDLMQTAFASQTKFKISKPKLDSEGTTILDDDNDKTISAIATPMKKEGYVNDPFQTPTKKKMYLGVKELSSSSSPQKSLIFKQKISYKKRTVCRKKPTITSTLAAGTLDQYFIGPDAEGKYTCKFFDKDIQCVCNRQFGRISNTRAHIQTHLSDRPFVCDECGKAFVRNHDLRRHKKCHTVAENICPCGKLFPRADALKRHRLRNICIGGISKSDGVSKPSTEQKATHRTFNAKDKTTDKILNKINSSLLPKESNLDVQNNDKAVEQKVKQDYPILQSNSQSIFGSNNIPKDIDLFNFEEIPVVDGNFSFNMDDSLVI